MERNFEIKNKEEFKEKVLTENKVLVQFYADWCGPCKMISPLIDEMVNENEDVKVARVNIDNNTELAINYGITSIPYLLIFENGTPTKEMLGARPKVDIEKLWNA